MPISEVHNMDCMEYMKDIPDKFFDLAIVDPPYGLGKKSTRGCGKLKRISLNKFGIDWDKAPEPEYFEEFSEYLAIRYSGEEITLTFLHADVSFVGTNHNRGRTFR